MLTNYIQGLSAESKVIQYLISQNYYIIAQRYRTKYGELDIIAIDRNSGNILCIIEVKYRRHSNRTGSINFLEQAEHFILPKQRYRIINATQVWLIENTHFLSQFFDVPIQTNALCIPCIRFDVACLSTTTFHYYANAFQSDASHSDNINYTYY